nr:hypothetical protein [Kibdelosporangium sp. MJ126-NF4]
MLQVAADGRWEVAEVVPLTEPARPVVERVAQVAGDDLAVEVLWPGQAFVGVRWPADSWEQAVDAVSRVVADPGTRDVEASLLALLGSTPSSELEFVDLGAVNAWRSIGPERLWQRGAAPTAQATDSVLARRPDLAGCPHPLAVELGVTIPRPCWVGVYVSPASGPVHRLVTDVLDRVV